MKLCKAGNPSVSCVVFHVTGSHKITKWLGLEGASNITQLLCNAGNMQLISKEPPAHTGRGKPSFVLI